MRKGQQRKLIVKHGEALLSDAQVIGRAIKEARERAGLQQAAVARMGRISIADVAGFEEGHRLPTMRIFSRLSASLHELRRLRPKVRDLLQFLDLPGSLDVPPEEPEHEEPADDDEQPRTPFAEHLRRLRRRDHLRMKDVADLVGVTDTTICAWEHDQSKPVLAHWEQLLEVWPELVATPPEWTRDIPPSSGVSAALPDQANAPELPESPMPVRQAADTLTAGSLSLWLRDLLAASCSPDAEARGRAFDELLSMAEAAAMAPSELAGLLRAAAGGER